MTNAPNAGEAARTMRKAAQDGRLAQRPAPLTQLETDLFKAAQALLLDEGYDIDTIRTIIDLAEEDAT